MMQMGVEASVPAVWFDGLDGQEDELTNVQRGKLDPSTGDEDDGEEEIRPDNGAAKFERDAVRDDDDSQRYPGFEQ